VKSTRKTKIIKPAGIPRVSSTKTTTAIKAETIVAATANTDKD